MSNSNINSQTLSEQIYNVLRHDIINQSIPCGSKLTLKSLQERFAVSSTPIREALTRLIQDGLVAYQTHTSITVIELNKKDAQELFQLQTDLDCLAIRYASQSENYHEVLSDLEYALRQDRFYLDKEDFLEAEKWSDSFHLTFYKHSNNSRLDNLAERIRSQISILTALYSSDQDMHNAMYHEHMAIYQSMVKHDIDKACQLMRQHLSHSLNYALKGLPSISSTELKNTSTDNY